MLSSVQVCELIGCSYRQLDYATRLGATPADSDATPGSGNRRRWSWEQVARLAVASHLAAASGRGGLPTGRGGFAEMAVAALNPELPDPPSSGFAVAIPGTPTTMTWVARWPDVRPLVDRGQPVVIVAYDLDALVDIAALDTATVPR